MMRLQVRMQSKDNLLRGPVAVLKDVVAKDGIIGLWRGTVPAAVSVCLALPRLLSLVPRLVRYSSGSLGLPCCCLRQPGPSVSHSTHFSVD